MPETAPVPLVPAAQYLRVSTERQTLSPLNQAATIAEYAAARGFQVVRSYEDGGRSGLTISGRPGLKQLIQDVVGGRADYKAILVYDVSRWGRFQDTDESAHYEFLCRQVGIDLHYCAEPFENDGSSVSALVKGMKRVMAAEYSRDLGRRIRAGQVRAVANGFRPGGAAPYGYQRMLVTEDGHVLGPLRTGERKSIGNQRVILAPGDRGEIIVVRRIFDLYVHSGWGSKQIAKHLRLAGVPTSEGGKWTQSTIARILTNEVYAGTTVFGNGSKHHRGPTPRCAPGGCVKKELAHRPLVSRRLFALAQDLRTHREPKPQLSDRQLIDTLRELVAKHGVFGRRVAVANPESFFCPTYRSRFGSMTEALRLTGLEGLPPPKFRPRRKYIRDQVRDDISARLRQMGIPLRFDIKSKQGIVAERLRFSILSVKTSYHTFLQTRWRGYMDRDGSPDIAIVLVSDHWDDTFRDCYIVSREPLDTAGLPPPTGAPMPGLERFRSADLEPFYKRAQIAAWLAGLFGPDFGAAR